MPALARHENNPTLVRFSVNVRPETKAALDEYAYRTRQTVSRAVDELLGKSAVAGLIAANTRQPGQPA
jgi:hypothetical protein